MTKIVTASIPDDLAPVWELVKKDFDGASSFFQDVLRGVAKSAENGAANTNARDITVLVVQRRLDLLKAQRQALDIEVASIEKFLQAPTTTPPPQTSVKQRATLEDMVVHYAKEMGDALDKRTDRELKNFARIRSYDGDAFVAAYRKYRAENPGGASS